MGAQCGAGRMTSDQAADSRDGQERPGQGGVPLAAIRPFVKLVPPWWRRRQWLQRTGFIPGHRSAHPAHEGPDRSSAAGQCFPWSGGQRQACPRATGDIRLPTVPVPRCRPLLVLPCS